MAHPLCTSIRVEQHNAGYCDYSLTDYSFLAHNRASVAVAAVICGLTNIGRTRDIDPLMAELGRLGVVKPEMVPEIALIQNKLLEVFYKNFPHLRPAASSSRSTSPTGVDGVFEQQARCASPPPPVMSAGKFVSAGVNCGAVAVTTACQAQFNQQQGVGTPFHQAPALMSTASAFGVAQ